MKPEKLVELVKIAKNISIKAHEGQFRNDGKTPFITHPEAVADFFKVDKICDGFVGRIIYDDWDKEEFECQIVSWLHDVIEDTDITLGDLLNQGIPFYLVKIIEILTHRENEEYLDYLLRVKENKLATKIKIADINHNLSTSTSKAQRIKYQLALYILEKL